MWISSSLGTVFKKTGERVQRKLAGNPSGSGGVGLSKCESRGGGGPGSTTVVVDYWIWVYEI